MDAEIPSPGVEDGQLPDCGAKDLRLSTQVVDGIPGRRHQGAQDDAGEDHR
jgi:hypothetical protein